MKQESIKVRDIKEALVALLRGKYKSKCKYYSRQVTEGMLLPAFFVDVRLVQQKDETINIVSKQFSCRIMYFQEDPNAENAEADQFAKIEEILNLLVCIDAKRNPKGNMVLKVKDRYLTVSECGVDYIGRENNIMELSFQLQFYDFKEVTKQDEEELMEELVFRSKTNEWEES